jgi:hypothetical protein
MSMLVMWWVFWRVSTACLGEASSVLEMRMGMTRLPEAVEMVLSDLEVGDERSRTPAMIVVLGRWRRASVRPRPSPIAGS